MGIKTAKFFSFFATQIPHVAQVSDYKIRDVNIDWTGKLLPVISVAECVIIVSKD
jgi:hypothetical protein